MKIYWLNLSNLYIKCSLYNQQIFDLTQILPELLRKQPDKILINVFPSIIVMWKDWDKHLVVIIIKLGVAKEEDIMKSLSQTLTMENHQEHMIEL